MSDFSESFKQAVGPIAEDVMGWVGNAFGDFLGWGGNQLANAASEAFGNETGEGGLGSFIGENVHGNLAQTAGALASFWAAGKLPGGLGMRLLWTIGLFVGLKALLASSDFGSGLGLGGGSDNANDGGFTFENLGDLAPAPTGE